MAEDEGAYPGKLTRYVTITCIIAAMGGLMVSYGLTGGVTSMDSFFKRFLLTKLKEDYDDDDGLLLMLTFYLCAIVSSILYGAVLTKEIGRKFSILYGSSIMLLGSLMFLLAALLGGFAKNKYENAELVTVMFGLACFGFGIGLLNHSVPLYVSEMAPYKYRGALNIGFQLFITSGSLVVNVLNYFFAQISGDWDWRLSFGGAMVPAIIVIVGSVFLPETPNSMIERGNQNEAREKLIKIRGVQNVDEEFTGLIAAGEASRRLPSECENLFQRKYRPYLTMAIAIPLFQQFTGINVIMFYLPPLFQIIGFGHNASLMSSTIAIGIVNVIATIVSIYGVDKWGRRKVFFGGGIQMFISQIVVAICIGLKPCVTANHCNIPEWYTILVVLFICTYFSGFALSWGPLRWLVPSEIFPLEIRCIAQSINVSINLLFTYITTLVLLKTHWHLTFWLFIFFGFLVVVITLFIYFFLPETKNIPIEEMSMVWKQHWYWSRFIKDFDYPDGDLQMSLGALPVEQV